VFLCCLCSVAITAFYEMLLPLDSVCSTLALLYHAVDLETGEYGRPKMKQRQRYLWYSGSR